MTTLTEIEAAADALSAEEKRELGLFLAARLRGANDPPPEPRRWSRRQMDEWIASDEAGLRRFNGGPPAAG